jgi:hypothetical protein
MDRYVCTGSVQPADDRSADAPCTAGDEYRLALQRQRHNRHCSRI